MGLDREVIAHYPPQSCCIWIGDAFALAYSWHTSFLLTYNIWTIRHKIKSPSFLNNCALSAKTHCSLSVLGTERWMLQLMKGGIVAGPRGGRHTNVSGRLSDSPLLKQIWCNIFRDAGIGSDVTVGTPTQIIYFLRFKDLQLCGSTFHHLMVGCCFLNHVE